VHVGTRYDFDLANRGLSNVNKQLSSFVIRFHPFDAQLYHPDIFTICPPPNILKEILGEKINKHNSAKTRKPAYCFSKECLHRHIHYFRRLFRLCSLWMQFEHYSNGFWWDSWGDHVKATHCVTAGQYMLDRSSLHSVSRVGYEGSAVCLIPQK